MTGVVCFVGGAVVIVGGATRAGDTVSKVQELIAKLDEVQTAIQVGRCAGRIDCGWAAMVGGGGPAAVGTSRSARGGGKGDEGLFLAAVDLSVSCVRPFRQPFLLTRFRTLQRTGL